MDDLHAFGRVCLHGEAFERSGAWNPLAPQPLVSETEVHNSPLNEEPKGSHVNEWVRDEIYEAIRDRRWGLLETFPDPSQVCIWKPLDSRDVEWHVLKGSIGVPASVCVRAGWGLVFPYDCVELDQISTLLLVDAALVSHMGFPKTLKDVARLWTKDNETSLWTERLIYNFTNRRDSTKGYDL